MRSLAHRRNRGNATWRQTITDVVLYEETKRDEFKDHGGERENGCRRAVRCEAAARARL